MDIGTSIIAGSIISLIGFIIIIQLNNTNWFKRQNWKFQAQNIKAENKLKLKKLERELGLQQSMKSQPEALGASNSSGISLLSDLAPLLSKLDGDQLSALAERFLPEGGGEEAGGVSGALLNFAQENPEVVQGIIKGISGKIGDNNINKQEAY